MRPARIRRDGAGSRDVIRGLDEAERDEIDADRQSESQIRFVLCGHARGRERYVRRVDPLVLAELTTIDHARGDRFRRRGFDTQLDLAVIEEQSIAGLHRRRKRRMRRRDQPRPSDERSDPDLESIAQ